MQIVKSELLVAVDCDDTLCMWTDPTIDGPDKITINFAGKEVYLVPHQYHIDLVKMYKKRGYHVTVWSANGWEHAEQVVIALGLTDSVDVVQSKLTKHVDDSEDASGILGPRVYCPDLTKPQYNDVIFTNSGTFTAPIGISQVAVTGRSGGSMPVSSNMETIVLGGVLNGR